MGHVLAADRLGIADRGREPAQPPGHGRLAGQPRDAGPGGIALPAPALPAGAPRSGRVDHHVADLACEARTAPHEAAARHDPAADARPERHEDEVVDAASRAEPVLGDGGGVRVVRDHAASSAQPRGEHRREVRARRAREVRGERDYAVVGQHPGHAHAEREVGQVPTGRRLEVPQHVTDRVGDRDARGVRGAGRRATGLGVDRAVGVREHREHLGAADVDADGRPGHARDSARAFSSRSAVPWILWAARCFTKPGIGTRSSTSSW